MAKWLWVELFIKPLIIKLLSEKPKGGSMINKNKEPFSLKISLDSIHLTEKSRQLNTLILGTKGTGKSESVIPSFAKQDFEANEAGCTFIVGTKDMAYTLYALAKLSGKKKKDIILLKPSVNMTVNILFDSAEYDYDKVAELIDFKEVIRKKKIVIIDMEWEKYRNYAIKATAMLLMQLQMDMQDTKSTSKKPHNIYIDDAYHYLPFLELILVASKSYNLSTTLLMQSRQQLVQSDSDYSPLIDNNVRNLILMNGITYDDAEFYRKRLIFSKTFPKTDTTKLDTFLKYKKDIIEVKEVSNGFLVFYNLSLREMLYRKAGSIIAEIIDKNSLRITKCCTLAVLTEAKNEDVRKLAIKTRKDLHKELGKPRIDKSEYVSLQSLNEEMKTPDNDIQAMISATEEIEKSCELLSPSTTPVTQDNDEETVMHADTDDTYNIDVLSPDIIKTDISKNADGMSLDVLTEELIQKEECPIPEFGDDLEIDGFEDIEDFAGIFDSSDGVAHESQKITSKKDEINKVINESLNDIDKQNKEPNDRQQNSDGGFDTEFELDRPAVKRISRFSTFRPKTMNNASKEMLSNIFQKMD